MTRLPVRGRKGGDAAIELAAPVDPGDSNDSSGPIRSAARKASAPAMITPDTASVREMLAGRPELLEPGLRVHGDAQGKPVGVDFSTEVGEIELLARDGSGSYVVVMVAAPGQGEDYIAEVLERMGWVRKHLATGSEKVRGILLMDQPPESLSYAAAAVADTVTFKTYRMSLIFEDLRI